jgi:hypothetical protein
MELPKNLKNDIWDFCRANDITDIDTFIVGLVKTAFTIEKYGYSPESGELAKPIEIEVVKEVIKEVIKEVPVEVEKIVEVEKLVLINDENRDLAHQQRMKEIEGYNRQLIELNEALKETRKGKGELEAKVEELTRTIAEKDEQIDKMSKADGRDIYGEKRIVGKLGSNLLDN